MHNRSYRTLRQAIGYMGLALPIFLFFSSGPLQESISDYYYTKMNVLFIGILFSFGLILITYRGNEESNSEYVLTNIAGICALLVALVPTIYAGSKPVGNMVVYAHLDTTRMWVHNISAIAFIFLMGLVVRKHFPKPGYYQKFYKTMAIIVFIGLAFAIFAFAYKSMTGDKIVEGGIFYGETVALWAFGLAWLRRGTHFQKKVWKLI